MTRCTSVSSLPGTATPKIQKAIKKALSTHKDWSCLVLDKAQDPLMPTVLSGIAPHLESGDIVLLSPAATSFASFTSYKERGLVFTQSVLQRFSPPTS